jgi:hypothetical protein
MSFYTNAGERLLINASGDAIIRTADRYLYANGTSGGTTIDAGFRFETSTPQLEFWVGDGERASINSSGALTVSGAGTFGGQVFTTVIGRANDTNTTIDFPGSDVIEMYTAGVLRTTLNSSGHLLIGKTADDNTTVGMALHDNGFMSIARSANVAMILDRSSSDGDILRFTKAGTEVGNIGTDSTDIYIGTGDTGIRFNDAVDGVLPYNLSTGQTDGTLDLGFTSVRWNKLFVSGGVSFQASSASFVDANYLDDYEEGTHDPTVTCGTSGTITVNSSFNTLFYTKVGRLVNVVGRIAVASVSSPVGSIIITLPFGSGDVHDASAAANVSINGIASGDVGDFWAEVDRNQSRIVIYKTGGTSVASTSAQEMGSGTDIRVMVTYQTQ